MTFSREIKTAKLSRKDAEKLLGSIADDSGPLTVEQIMADPNISKVTHARDIHTGEMKPADEHHNHTGIPFFVIKAGG